MNQNSSLVDAIFTKCSLIYGRDFLGRWEGQNLAEVKADWVRELGPILGNPAAVLYGLENLPERPPTVLQFRAVCRNRPDTPALALPAPQASPADRARVAKMLAEVRAKLTGGA